MSSLICSLALVNRNENEKETITPRRDMQLHDGEEPYAYVLHTDERYIASHPFVALKFTRFREQG